MDEAVEWVKRMPFDSESAQSDAEIEIRPIFEAEDFGAEFTPELREQEDRIRAKAAQAQELLNSYRHGLHGFSLIQ